MKRIISKHPLAIRWFHWLNFPLLGVMVWSGLLIYWANDVYRIGWGNNTILKFFPKNFYEAFNIPFRLAEGMNLHFFFMWLFIFNGMLYVIYLFVSREYKTLFPKKGSIREAWRVVLHDLRINKSITHEESKYNAAQRIIYTIVLLMGIFMILTGFAIYKPVQLNWLCSILGGYEMARAEHFYTTILFCLFFLVHIIQVIRAGWNNFRAMITGFVIDKNHPHKEIKNKPEQ